VLKSGFMSTVSCLVNRFDHIEIATTDAAQLEKLFSVFGFATTQVRESDKGLEKLLVEGQNRILLNQGKPGTFAFDYARKHGDGVCSIAFHSTNAAETLKTACARGAKVAAELSVDEGLSGSQKVKVSKTAIQTFGDVRATFVERSAEAFNVNAPFGPGFKTILPQAPAGIGLLSIDHLTNNVEMGQMERWAEFYQTVYGWVEARYFDIRAEKTGLISKVLQSPDGGCKIPINEATEEKSQVQEFIVQHKGAGVQHIAFLTADIRKAVSALAKSGVKFLSVPDTYYEAVPTRVKMLSEPIAELKQLQILADGDDKGYLLQIFTQNQIGPLFFEIIQRKGHNGFGEGNFKALFEAIERDQERRGVL
jgi:4-hydroxyphenylpyruvate dioxygenase